MVDGRAAQTGAGGPLARARQTRSNAGLPGQLGRGVRVAFRVRASYALRAIVDGEPG